MYTCESRKYFPALDEVNCQQNECVVVELLSEQIIIDGVIKSFLTALQRYEIQLGWSLQNEGTEESMVGLSARYS